jgi:hypothetical protein
LRVHTYAPLPKERPCSQVGGRRAGPDLGQAAFERAGCEAVDLPDSC